MRVLDHDDGAVDHGADGDGDPAQTHDVGVESHHLHDEQAGKDRHRDDEDRHQTAAHVEQKHDADEGDDDQLFDQFFREVFNGSFDQRRPVVFGHDVHAHRESLFQFVKLVFDVANDSQRVFPETHDDNAADHLALALGFGDPAAQFGAEVDVGDISQVYRGSGRRGANHDLLEIFDALRRAHATQQNAVAFRLSHLLRRQGGQVAATADHVFRLGHFEHATAHIVVGHLDGHLDHAEGNVVGEEPVGVDLHLVLSHEPPDGGDFGYSLDGRQLISQVPILNASQFGKVILSEHQLGFAVPRTEAAVLEDAHALDLVAELLGRLLNRGVPLVRFVRMAEHPVGMMRAVIAVAE